MDVKEQDIQVLKERILNNQPILFLGAGFSRESICEKGKMPTGEELKEELIDEFFCGNVDEQDLDEVKSMGLREVCDQINYINNNEKEKLNEYLTSRFKNVRPNDSGFHKKIINYPWTRIYTVNIDDLLENIFTENKFKYHIFDGNKKHNEDEIEIIKLHGSVLEPEKGYIFSQSEYNELIAKRLDPGLNEFTLDLLNCDVIFVGTLLDEPDVEYYLQTYENAGYKSRNNKVFFIEPYPSLRLKRKASQLDAVILQWKAEEFLNFISELSYFPKEIEKIRLRLNYNFLYRLSDNKALFESIYESSIYEGYSCIWQDIYEKWVFDNHNYIEAKKKFDEYIKKVDTVGCFSIYGEAFSGKSTLLKQLGFELEKLGYEVIEFRGRQFKRNVFLDYIEKCSFDNIGLLIDNASYYYNEIEKIFEDYRGNKKVIIITASRIYYHQKKKYYLEGNPFYEFRCNDIITNEDSQVIINKLVDKGYLKSMSKDEYKCKTREIVAKRSLCNLIIDLTYGTGLKKRVMKNVAEINKLTPNEQKFLIEVSIFDNANIEVYPNELFVMKYGKLIDIDEKIDKSQFRIIDYVKADMQGLSLRNSLFHKRILEVCREKVVVNIVDILNYISRFVIESTNDIWKIIFQSLAQYDSLAKLFNLSNKEIGEIFYSIKDYYKNNSYYWLQLGLYEQRLGDYSKALNHLLISSQIRPNSFKIQHAIARNYLRHANDSESFAIAEPLFLEGEKLIVELVESKEYYKKKAKPFSVHCLVEEKVKFIKKFDYNVSDEELKYLIRIVLEVENQNEHYMKHAVKVLYKLLKQLDKLSLLILDLNSTFLQCHSEELEENTGITDEYDSIVNSL